MSDSFINVRIIFWHFKITYKLNFRISSNAYWKKRKLEAFLKPISFYDFEVLEMLKKMRGAK